MSGDASVDDSEANAGSPTRKYLNIQSQSGHARLAMKKNLTQSPKVNLIFFLLLLQYDLTE